jgi:phosphatidylglycerophosphate synthase
MNKERDLIKPSIHTLLDRISWRHRKAASYLPSAVTFLRLGVLPMLVFFMDSGEAVLADSLFLLAISSDLVDGYLARKLGVSSRLGASLDVCIDFLFIAGVFLYFTIRGIYPAWVLMVIIAVFVQFLVTSKLTGVVFDPVGKYYGSLLYGAIGLTMLFPGKIARGMIAVAFVGVSAVSLFGRSIYYLKKRK